jgi:hypothetical protein
MAPYEEKPEEQTMMRMMCQLLLQLMNHYLMVELLILYQLPDLNLICFDSLRSVTLHPSRLDRPYVRPPGK